MTDRLYFDDGTHKDYAAIIEREASVTGVTPNGDREYFGYDEVTKTIQGVERYSRDGDDGETVHFETEIRATDNPSQATEVDGTDGTSQPSTVPSNGREELQKAMIDVGVDVSHVGITRHDSDGVFRIKPDKDIDKSEGSVWRTWADPIFSDDDGPGDIKWHDDGYPDHFVLPYDALEDVVG